MLSWSMSSEFPYLEKIMNHMFKQPLLWHQIPNTKKPVTFFLEQYYFLGGEIHPVIGKLFPVTIQIATSFFKWQKNADQTFFC